MKPSHGIDPDNPTPILFRDESQQKKFKSIRQRGRENWEAIRTAAHSEDKDGTKKYLKTEQLLTDLKAITKNYLRLALPRLQEMVDKDEL
jgi:hypothetical protein